MKTQIALTDAEWKIMQALWDKAPQTIMQLVAALRPSTGWAKSTVITLLGRMTDKGALRYEDGGRAKLYSPAVTRQELAPFETETLLRRIYGGSLSMLVNTMLESKGLTQQELQELKAILGKAGRSND